MIEYKIAGSEDIELLMSSRLEMLRIVNDLDDDYQYDEKLISCSKDYFLNGDQTTVPQEDPCMRALGLEITGPV